MWMPKSGCGGSFACPQQSPIPPPFDRLGALAAAYDEAKRVVGLPAAATLTIS